MTYLSFSQVVFTFILSFYLNSLIPCEKKFVPAGGIEWSSGVLLCYLLGRGLIEVPLTRRERRIFFSFLNSKDAMDTEQDGDC